MKLLSDARYRELMSAEDELERLDKEDVKGSRDFAKKERRIRREIREEFEDREEELLDSHRKEIRELNQELVEVKDQAEADVQKVQKEADEKVEKAAADQKAALSKRESALVERESKAETKEIQLKAREKRVDHRERSVQNAEKRFSGRVKQHAQEVVSARKEGEEIGEKRGYANGSADMARSIGDLTKEDRKQSADMGNKALDAVIASAKQESKAPEINVLSVPVAQPQVNQNQTNKK